MAAGSLSCEMTSLAEPQYIILILFMAVTNALSVPDVNASSQVNGATVTMFPISVPVTVTSPPAVLLESVHLTLLEAISTKSMLAESADMTPKMAVLLADEEAAPPMVILVETNILRAALPRAPTSALLLVPGRILPPKNTVDEAFKLPLTFKVVPILDEAAIKPPYSVATLVTCKLLLTKALPSTNS